MSNIEQRLSGNRARLPDDRRQRIAQVIRDTGAVTVAMLESEFGISAATVRRDLESLERAGQARRTHGGAVLPGIAGHEDSFEQRLGEAVGGKKRLAEAVAELIEPGCTMFIDSSTTAYYAVQRILTDRKRTTFISNLLPVMEIFKTPGASGANLVGIGGSFRDLTKSFVGPHAVHMVRAHFTDMALLSAKGVTPEGEMMDPDPSEAEVKRAMIGRSELPTLLVDGRKFERRGLSLIGHVSELSRVLVADGSEANLRNLEQQGVEVRNV